MTNNYMLMHTIFSSIFTYELQTLSISMSREFFRRVKNMGESRRSSREGFNFAILVFLIIILLSTIPHGAAEAVKKNKSTISKYLQCDGSNKDQCVPISDGVEMELLMGSEASNRIFEASAASTPGGRPTGRALNPADAACGRMTGKSCSPNKNPGKKVSPNCSLYNKNCPSGR
ncbi:hypothetical protein PTKIN_Ptkin15bG0176600 [Pterospermum kingtungense]